MGASPRLAPPPPISVDGTPHPAALATAAAWAADLADGPGDDADRALVARLAALCDRRGEMAFGSADRLAPALREAAAAVGWGEDSPVRRSLAALPPGREERVDFEEWDPDAAPGFQSDDAALGLLRTGWERTADALALAWPDGGLFPHDPAAVGLELRALGRRLLAGPWGVTLSVAGEPVDLTGGWACVCHHADADGGYLELQWAGETAAGPARLERQAFLSREGRFAVLADAVSLTAADAIDVTISHSMTLPAAASVTAGVGPDTREARFFGGPKRYQRGRLFPLALPQHRFHPAAGSLAADDDGVTVRHASRGGLVSPVVLDWHPDREELPADWRALTVTEDRRRLTDANAAAHRLRIGKRHTLLLCRRTDDSREQRAVLGHHHDREALIAAFNRTGEVTPLLVV